MAGKHLDKSPFSFADIALHFSSEELDLLTPCQRQLYEAVMIVNYENMIFVGGLTAYPERLLASVPPQTAVQIRAARADLAEVSDSDLTTSPQSHLLLVFSFPGSLTSENMQKNSSKQPLEKTLYDYSLCQESSKATSNIFKDMVAARYCYTDEKVPNSMLSLCIHFVHDRIESHFKRKRLYCDTQTLIFANTEQ